MSGILLSVQQALFHLILITTLGSDKLLSVVLMKRPRFKTHLPGIETLVCLTPGMHAHIPCSAAYTFTPVSISLVMSF